MKYRFFSLIALLFVLSPALFAANFGVRAGRLNDAEENFVGAEVLFNIGSININPNVEYWLVDEDNVTAGTANLDVTLNVARIGRVTPYVGAGVGLFYIDTDLGDDTETLGNLLGGLNLDLDFLKPYAQVKYSRSLEDSDGDNDEVALAVGLRF